MSSTSLKLQDEGTVKRVALVYPTQQTRDTAFIEMDRLVRAYEAAQAVREDDDL